MKPGMLLGIALFLLGNVLAWFQFNSQFVWEYWKDKILLSNLLFAIPMGACFWLAIKNIVLSTNELWASKLIGFGVSNVVFAVMTYVFMKESIFTAKTMTCMLLAAAIISVQIFWK
tara:strand:- start:611 stop:958 length:348 start_codon:yes stop_codon:yes gene_type:complete